MRRAIEHKYRLFNGFGVRNPLARVVRSQDADAQALEHSRRGPLMVERDAAVSNGPGTGTSALLVVAVTLVALRVMPAPRAYVLTRLQSAKSACASFRRAPTALLEETVLIPATSSRGLPIWLPFPGDLRLEVNVVEGASANVHVMSAVNWKAFEKAEGRLLNGRFHFDHPEFQALSTAQVLLTGYLLEGPYFIVIENPTVGGGAVQSYTVHVKAKLKPVQFWTKN